MQLSFSHPDIAPYDVGQSDAEQTIPKELTAYQAVTFTPKSKPFLSGVSVLGGSFKATCSGLLTNKEAKPLVVFLFVCSGRVNLATFQLPLSGRYTVFLLSLSNLYLEITEAAPCELVAIGIEVSLFRHLTGFPDPTELSVAEASVWPILPTMKTLLSALIQNQSTDTADRLLLEANVLELLSLHVKECQRSAESAPEHPDYEKLIEARRLLQSRYDAPPTLGELSRLVGLNEFKLKKGFKSLFHNSIYGWVLNYRLQRAYELLKSGEHSVSEVAYIIGYQHPAHFTTAFRKKFGVPPREVAK